MTMQDQMQDQNQPQNQLHFPQLHIANFRGIPQMNVPELQPVTIITGPSGSQKTTVLDAVQTHANRGDPDTLREILRRAGEVDVDLDTRKTFPDRDALFTGWDRQLEIRIGNGNPKRDIGISAEPEDILTLAVQAGDNRMKIDLSRETDWRFRINFPQEHAYQEHSFRGPTCVRIGPEPATDQEIAELWDHSVIEGLELQLDETLSRSMINGVERIACIGDVPNRRAIVKQTRKTPQRAHLRSLGSGALQTARLIMAVQKAQGGILLLDQPETGLDPRQLELLTAWMIHEACPRNTQVLIVTNSPDLPGIAEGASQATLHHPATTISMGTLMRTPDPI